MTTPHLTGEVLFLRGTWTWRRDIYRFEAMLSIGAAGNLGGPISWRGPVSGTETCCGDLSFPKVGVQGKVTDPGLACEQYSITLHGGRQGSFAGTSRTFGTWAGKMTGEYEFWRPASPA